MKKSEKIFNTLRKFDYEWSKKSKTFCEIVKEFTNGGNLELTDEEVLQNIKDVFPDEKEIKEK